MHDTKVKHIHAEELVKQMCSTGINKGDHSIAWDVLGTALSTAATHDIHELTEQCIHHHPGLIYYDIGGFFLFLVAIRERQEKVYNLLYQMSGHKVFVAIDKINGENALDIAGTLAPSHHLNTVFSGEHKELLKEAQQWMKDTSSSATVVAALLVTNGICSHIFFAK